jgi:uncharacterized protein (TIGR03067 family)
MWSAICLVLGPLLAAVLAWLWSPKPDPNSSTLPFTSGGVFFLAGLAPRFVASTMEEALRRFLALATGASVAAARTMPLSQVRGITAQIEDRLTEEGVLDVFGLATTDPAKLFRNTSFDLRQIVSWIDEAILIWKLPQNWQALQNAGITGAIDLAWYSKENDDQQDPKIVDNLAQQVNMNAAVLRAAIDALYEDAQVQLVWVLYQLDADAAPDEALRPLQGVWQLTSRDVSGQTAPTAECTEIRMALDANGTFWMLKGAREFSRGRLTIVDDDAAPAQLDVEFLSGDRGGQRAIAIYQLGANDLKICDAPSDKGRPTSFSSAGGDANTNSTWKRL